MDEKFLKEIEFNSFDINVDNTEKDAISEKNDNSSLIINQNENNIISEYSDYEIISKDSNENLISSKDSNEYLSDSSSEIIQDPDSIEHSKLKNKRNIKLYNIKDHLMMFILLISSSLNFNFLYILPFLIGLYYIYLLFKNNENKKSLKLKLELIILIYSLFFLIIKIVLIGIIDNDHLDTEKQIKSLYNIGIKYTKLNSNFYDIFITFFGEGLLIVFSALSIIISFSFKKLNMENNEILLDKEKLFIKLKKLIFLIYFFILMLATFNRSFLTFIYLFFYQLMLLVVLIKNDNGILIKFYSNIRLFFLLCTSIQLLLINILNIYDFQQKYLMKNKIPTNSDDSNFDKVYSIWTKIGINCSYHYLPLKIFNEWVGYFSAVCILIIFASSKKIINECKYSGIEKNNTKDNNNVSKNKQHKNKIYNFLRNIVEIIKNIVNTPKFIINLCRIFSILWIYKMENYYSIGVFLFVFCSFIFNSIIYYLLIIIFILIPFTCISTLCLHLSNINGFFENIPEVDKEFYMHFGFEKLDEGKLKYFLIGMYYFCIMLFINSISDYTSSILNENSISFSKKSQMEELKELNEDKKMPLLSKEEINNKEDKLLNNNGNDFTFLDIIMKIVLRNVDRITLIVMYFIAINTVNLIHLIFMIIFMAQILSPNTLKKHSTIVIVIIQILFLIEYLVELTKNYYLNFFESQLDFLKTILTIDNEKKKINIYIEIFCYCAVYCFYEQKIILNSELFKKLDKNHNISFKNYINIKFKKMRLVRITLFTIFYSILEFYAWIIIVCFFLISYIFQINILFVGKLILFFIVIYNFVIKIQIMKKNQNISLRVNKFLIAYCCFNTLIVYGYQLNFPFFSKINISENFLIQNLPTFGLVRYEEALVYKLLPHFLSIFLSTILYYEIKVIYSKVNDDDNNIFDIIENSENNSKNIINIEEKDQINIIGENNNNENNNNSSENVNDENKNEKGRENQIVKEDINEEENLIIKYMNIRDKIDNLNRKYIISGIIIFFLSTYRPFLFILVCYIFITYNFSFAMIIYFLIFGITYIRMFSSLLNNTCHYNYEYYHPFFFTQYIRYKSVEVKKHKSITNNYKYIMFRFLIIFSLIFLLMNYIYIVFVFLKVDCNDNIVGYCKKSDRIIEKSGEIGQYIKAFVYLFGIYINYDDIKIFKSSWQFFLFLLLSCIDIYIQKLLSFILKKNEKNRDEHKDLLRQKLHIKYLIKFEKRQILDDNFLNQNSWKNKENIKKNFEKFFLSIFENSKNIKEMCPTYTSKRRVIMILRFIKKVFEYFIICFLFGISIIKTNIWSFFYLIIAIILLVQQKKIYNFNLLSIMIIISILIQSLIFLSNINNESYPNFDEVGKEIINNTLSLPWYYKLLKNSSNITEYEEKKKYIFFFGLGNKRSQIQLLSTEYIVIIIIYFYLYHFCFTIYNSNYAESKYWYHKNDDITGSLLLDHDLRDKIYHTVKYRYDHIKNCMYNNFNIKIIGIRNLKNNILQLNNNKKEVKKNITKDFFVRLHEYILYLSFHIVILVIILLISMMIYGIISALYILLCLYFLYNSKAIYQGKKYNYPILIKKILLTIFVCDICLQVINQIPYNISGQNSKHKQDQEDEEDNQGIYINIISGLGLMKIIKKNLDLSTDGYLLLGKCVCLFCICLQNLIYSSNSFVKFYLSYLIVKDEKFKITSIINSFQFNNERIQAMEKSILLKKDMENSMNNLQKDLEEWNKKLFNENNNNDNPTQNDKENEITFHLSSDKLLLMRSNSEKEYADENLVEKIVKKWILNYNILIKIHIFLNKISFWYKMSINEKEGDMFILNCIQGKEEKNSYLEKIIDEQISTLDLSKFYLKELKVLKTFLINDCKENKKLKVNINDDKYKQFAKFKTNKLFTKYLRKSYLIKKIIRNLLLIITNNFNWICYFVMILNHILNASLISLFYPISFFCYAIFEYPRPPKQYWLVCLKYTFIVLIIKCMLQKQFIGGISFKNESNEKIHLYEILGEFFNRYPIGIEIFDNNIYYFFYLLIDFSLIVTILLNINFLVINGLWKKKEQYIENIYEALERITVYKDLKFDKIDEISSFNSSFLTNKITNNKYLRKGTVKKYTNKLKNKKLYSGNLLNDKNKKYDENKKNYFKKLFTRVRNEKPGRDYYYYYSLIMIIIIFYLLVFYTRMIQDKTFGAINIKTNQFSEMTIILVLLHLTFLIYDRVIYLRQNKNEVKIDYIFFDKEKHKKISENEYLEIKNEIIDAYPKSNINNNFIIPFECMDKLSPKFNIVYIQNENFNMPLLEKYILHMLLSIISHFFIFFYVTMAGNFNINNALYCIKEQTDECNDFLENWSIIVFYLLYLIYLIFSGLQIKYGFYDFRRRSVFKNIKSINAYIFDVYKLIPFYYPIKNVVDWTFTSTTFSLFEWFKFENLYDNIFKTYRSKRLSYNKPIGKKVKKYIKIIIGGSISFILVLILIVPLILYSSLNPTNQLNNITSAQTKIFFSFIDNDKQIKNILIFESEWAESIKNMFEEGKKVWEHFNYSNSIYTKNFPQDQIQIVKLYSEPENTLSQFKINLLSSNIESLLNNTEEYNDTSQIASCKLIIETTFTRPLPNEAKSVTKKTELEMYNYIDIREDQKKYEELSKLNDFLKGNNTQNISDINIYGFSPYVRLTVSDEAKALDSINFIQNFTITLRPFFKNNAYLFYFYFNSKLEKKLQGIEYHLFNEKVSSSTFGYSVIGFYSAFILVIGTYISNIFDYKTEKIVINEMPHPEKLINLCECIKISRYTYDFKKEQYLFNILIEIMRTPEFVKILTKTTLEQYEYRKKIPQ